MPYQLSHPVTPSSKLSANVLFCFTLPADVSPQPAPQTSVSPRVKTALSGWPITGDITTVPRQRHPHHGGKAGGIKT